MAVLAADDIVCAIKVIEHFLIHSASVLQVIHAHFKLLYLFKLYKTRVAMF